MITKSPVPGMFDSCMNSELMLSNKTLYKRLEHRPLQTARLGNKTITILHYIITKLFTILINPDCQLAAGIFPQQACILSSSLRKCVGVKEVMAIHYFNCL